MIILCSVTNKFVEAKLLFNFDHDKDQRNSWKNQSHHISWSWMDTEEHCSKVEMFAANSEPVDQVVQGGPQQQHSHAKAKSWKTQESDCCSVVN